MKTRVLIADSYPAFVMGVESTVQNEPDLLLVSKAQEGVQAVQEIRRLQPDVCLVELELPKINGLNIIASISREGIASRIIIMTGSAKGSVIHRAFTEGAAGFLSKREPLGKIYKAIRNVYNGSQVLSESLKMELKKYQQSQNCIVADIPPLMHFLTGRELEVLRCIARGISIVETARELHMSATTVKHHRHVIFAKLGVANAPAAVYTAMRGNLLP
ncbi:response regulator transcription factor [Microbulbifer rhizosphaerae]|uniref:Two-component system nitrate/nitrite response regulator NarL n=1 Tax=Microbulbifer rhizosphaerae TaxID=1562603 RepID=A0A7W4Z7V4_9GAMM|nr:response regulator transcription factor [Microbulbifer rhizosphaerae]MBB3060148.1 two-component system nitrate/nitrite response regulator NarL [Microbulbifer rhizosphaerae]